MNYRIEQLRFLLREDPSSRVFYQLGELLRREGDHVEAVEVLRSGLERHPRYVAAWVSLGRAELAATGVGRAEEAFKKALALDPQNAVAARMIAESAIALEDWPRASRALKLARELAPADLELDEKIAHVETRLMGAVAVETSIEPEPEPEIEAQPAEEASRDTAAIRVADVMAPPSEEPFDVVAGGDTGMWRSMQEVFAAAEPPKPAEQPGPGPPIEMSDDEVAQAIEEGLEPDVSAAVEAVPEPSAPEPEPPAPPSSVETGPLDLTPADLDLVASMPDPDPVETGPLELTPVDVDLVLSMSEPDPDADPEQDHDYEREPTRKIMLEPGPELEPEPDPELGGESVEVADEVDERMPLPTLTLARLALDQGDTALAMTTLESVLEQNPDQEDAAELLERLQNPPPVPQPTVYGATRVMALQGWLDAVRLAAERLAP